MHTLFWFGFAVLFYVSTVNILPLSQGIVMLGVSIISQFILTFVNNMYLLPKLFDHKRYLTYSISVLVGIAIVVYVRYTVNESIVMSLNRFPNLKLSGYFLFIIVTTLVVFLITTGFYFFKQWFIERQKQDEIANQQLDTELKLLKAQINPHFLFNALNNVYSLTQVEPEKAGEMILKLSDVLRYMLYDSEKDKIYLEKEISNINSLIELHQIQYDNKAKINFVISGNIHDKLIHPMLLFPFFENAFKHGNLFQFETSSYIQANLAINNNQLNFTIENTFVENTSKDKVGGLGIGNVQKRLQLFYHNMHQLIITKGEKIFKIDLKIQLD
jgi:sensor histidine kinase YesM